MGAGIDGLRQAAKGRASGLYPVELDQGVHLNTTLVGAKPEDLRVGQRLRPVFDERPGSTTLLRYTPIESAQASVITAEQSAAPEPAPAAVAEAPQRSV